MQRSLFGKYLRIIMGVLLASFVVISSIVMVSFTEYVKNDKKTLLTQSANSFSMIASNVDMSTEGGLKVTELFLQSFSLNIDADIFATDLNGNLLIGSFYSSRNYFGQSFSGVKSVPRDIVDRAVSGEYYVGGNKNGIYPTSYFVVGVPMYKTEDAGVPVGAVFAATSTASITEFQWDVLQMLFAAQLIAFLLAFGVVGIFAYRIVRPLRQISAAAKALGEGNFSVRVQVSTSDEVGQLAAAFNNMANSLSVSESSNRSFVANVSHELKTPMTTIAGFIDGILDGTIPAEKQSFYLNIVSDEVKRLSRLVHTMLNLSRIDNGGLKLRPSDFDMSETVLSTVLTFEKSIEDKQIDVRGLDTFSPKQVHGDEDLLHQVVYNLVENAVKFTNTGGYIHFTVTDSIDRVAVIIENSGPGIQPEELPMVFEKFYKTDKSRSQDKNGMGLGLYLVKTIIHLHGGDISVTSEVNRFTRFSFYIPKPQEGPKQKPNFSSPKVEDAVITQRPKKDKGADRGKM